MPRSKKKAKRPAQTQTQTAGGRLASSLSKCQKAELIELLVDLAEDDCGVMRWLESALDVEKPSEEIVSATREAIADATDFDERQINRNFDYDYEAYKAVARNLAKLIETGDFSAAMSLSLELMEQGSYQVEVSDEGMMTDDIEDCLKVVIKALKRKGSCAPNEIVEWCAAMAKKDRVGFICDAELQELRELFE